MSVAPVQLESNTQADAVRSAVRYFFIVGQMRSGTNWACALLNLHPKIHCHGEYHFERLFEGVEKFTSKPNALGSAEPLRSEAIEHFRAFVRSTMRRQLKSRPGAAWVGDRTPRELATLFDGAAHFLLIRDGRDALVSRAHHELRMNGLRGKPFESKMAAHAAAFQRDPEYFHRRPELLFDDLEYLERLARLWSERMGRDLEAVRRMENGDIDGRVRIVRYERLYADVERERSEMYRFLDLDPDDAAPVSRESHTTPGFESENPHSFRRRGEVGDWRNYATDDFRHIVKEHAGEMLIQLGYETNLDW